MAALLLVLAAPALLPAEEGSAAARGKALFAARCSSCHTIAGGDLAGPDLAGVTERRDLQWLHRFIREPSALFLERDPTALFLLQKYFGAAMPDPGLSEADAVWLLAYFSSCLRGPALPVPGVTGRRQEHLLAAAPLLE